MVNFILTFFIGAFIGSALTVIIIANDDGRI